MKEKPPKRPDPTALSYWFPKIMDAGLPVPKTVIVKMPAEAAQDIWQLFDGEHGEGRDFAKFEAVLRLAAAEVGYPLFLRTDHTSGKHNWAKTCYVPASGDLGQHTIDIATFSEMAGIFGLPWDTWALREMLPTTPLGVCPGYGSMPVCREFRFFVKDGHVVCWHPYWPKQSLVDGGAFLADADFDFDALCRMDGDTLLELTDLAQRAGAAVGGAWSVDLLETKRGWFLTDMAEAGKSFHWEGCEAEIT